jgi:hypothetical protein
LPTLMCRTTFDELARIRVSVNNGPLSPRKEGRLAGIFVPWAGARIKDAGGIYYVGMATHGDYWADDPQIFDQKLQHAESLCNNRDDRAPSPFWQFLDGLTWALLGGPFDKTSDRWGWSNLLKIGWSTGNPNQWRAPIEPNLEDAQRDSCVTALREEFEQLHGSLIVIGSGNTFGVLESPDLLEKLVPQWNWNKDNEQTGVWWFTDSKSGNLYVNCEHPRRAVNCLGWFLGIRTRLHNTFGPRHTHPSPKRLNSRNN